MTGIELDRIQIRTPCPKSWDEMQGDARTRFCSACALHVHNLSALPRAAGEALLAERAAGGRLCVTYARRADGTIVTADAPAPRTPAAPRIPWTLHALRSAASLLGAVPFLSALAGAAALAGCSPASPRPDPAPADPGAPAVPPPADPSCPRLMGEIALPEPLIQMTGGVSVEPEPERELGKVAIEQGDVALPSQGRD